MTVQPILVPYALSRREYGTGCGPAYLWEHGLNSLLGDREPAEPEWITLEEDTDTDVEALFAACHAVGEAVRRATFAGAFPLTVAGNCFATVGAVSGLEKENLGLLWLDAHGDFNTPEITTTGFLDGMALSTVTGRCWQALAGSLPGYIPLAGEKIAHLGGRSFDPAEAELLAASGISLCGARDLREGSLPHRLDTALQPLVKSGVSRIYLHLDLDVLDPAEAPANHFATGSGVSVAQLSQIMTLIRQRFSLAGCTVSSFNPICDIAGNTTRAALGLISVLSAE